MLNTSVDGTTRISICNKDNRMNNPKIVYETIKEQR
jgi:hypothetical protein